MDYMSYRWNIYSYSKCVIVKTTLRLLFCCKADLMLPLSFHKFEESESGQTICFLDCEDFRVDGTVFHLRWHQNVCKPYDTMEGSDK